MDSGEKFNLIFMDVQMPNLDGIQSTRLIRSVGFQAPIVALTAFSEKSNEEECMASGMNYFLPKPIRQPALKHVLRKYCAPIPEEDLDNNNNGRRGAPPPLKSATSDTGVNHVKSASQDAETPASSGSYQSYSRTNDSLDETPKSRQTVEVEEVLKKTSSPVSR